MKIFAFVNLSHLNLSAKVISVLVQNYMSQN